MTEEDGMDRFLLFYIIIPNVLIASSEYLPKLGRLGALSDLPIVYGPDRST